MRLVIAAVVALACAFGPAVAETPAGMEAAVERAKYVKQFKEMLDTADEIEALIYVEEGLKSDEAQVRRLAFEWGPRAGRQRHPRRCDEGFAWPAFAIECAVDRAR